MTKDQKQILERLKDLVLKREQHVIEFVIFNQIEFKENYTIANHFNSCFIESIKAISDNM